MSPCNPSPKRKSSHTKNADPSHTAKKDDSSSSRSIQSLHKILTEDLNRVDVTYSDFRKMASPSCIRSLQRKLATNTAMKVADHNRSLRDYKESEKRRLEDQPEDLGTQYIWKPIGVKESEKTSVREMDITEYIGEFKQRTRDIMKMRQEEMSTRQCTSRYKDTVGYIADSRLLENKQILSNLGSSISLSSDQEDSCDIIQENAVHKVSDAEPQELVNSSSTEQSLPESTDDLVPDSNTNNGELIGVLNTSGESGNVCMNSSSHTDDLSMLEEKLRRREERLERAVKRSNVQCSDSIFIRGIIDELIQFTKDTACSEPSLLEFLSWVDDMDQDMNCLQDNRIQEQFQMVFIYLLYLRDFNKSAIPSKVIDGDACNEFHPSGKKEPKARGPSKSFILMLVDEVVSFVASDDAYTQSNQQRSAQVIDIRNNLESSESVDSPRALITSWADRVFKYFQQNVLICEDSQSPPAPQERTTYQVLKTQECIDPDEESVKLEVKNPLLGFPEEVREMERLHRLNFPIVYLVPKIGVCMEMIPLCISTLIRRFSRHDDIILSNLSQMIFGGRTIYDGLIGSSDCPAQACYMDAVQLEVSLRDNQTPVEMPSGNSQPLVDSIHDISTAEFNRYDLMWHVFQRGTDVVIIQKKPFMDNLSSTNDTSENAQISISNHDIYAILSQMQLPMDNSRNGRGGSVYHGSHRSWLTREIVSDIIHTFTELNNLKQSTISLILDSKNILIRHFEEYLIIRVNSPENSRSPLTSWKIVMEGCELLSMEIRELREMAKIKPLLNEMENIGKTLYRRIPNSVLQILTMESSSRSANKESRYGLHLEQLTLEIEAVENGVRNIASLCEHTLYRVMEGIASNDISITECCTGKPLRLSNKLLNDLASSIDDIVGLFKLIGMNDTMGHMFDDHLQFEIVDKITVNAVITNENGYQASLGLFDMISIFCSSVIRITENSSGRITLPDATRLLTCIMNECRICGILRNVPISLDKSSTRTDNISIQIDDSLRRAFKSKEGVILFMKKIQDMFGKYAREAPDNSDETTLVNQPITNGPLNGSNETPPCLNYMQLISITIHAFFVLPLDLIVSRVTAESRVQSSADLLVGELIQVNDTLAPGIHDKSVITDIHIRTLLSVIPTRHEELDGNPRNHEINGDWNISDHRELSIIFGQSIRETLLLRISAIKMKIAMTSKRSKFGNNPSQNKGISTPKPSSFSDHTGSEKNPEACISLTLNSTMEAQSLEEIDLDLLTILMNSLDMASKLFDLQKFISIKQKERVDDAELDICGSPNPENQESGSAENVAIMRIDDIVEFLETSVRSLDSISWWDPLPKLYLIGI